MTTVRCADCRRILRATPVRDPGTRLPYGPCCAARRGLGPARRPRTAQPQRTTNPEQPSLLDQLVTSGERSDDHERDPQSPATGVGAVTTPTRCPVCRRPATGAVATVVGSGAQMRRGQTRYEPCGCIEPEQGGRR